MKLKVYVKTVCSQCAPVKGYLKSKNIPFELINIDNDETAYEHLKQNNVQSTPYLEVIEGDTVIETSSGLKASVDIMNWHKEGVI